MLNKAADDFRLGTVGSLVSLKVRQRARACVINLLAASELCEHLGDTVALNFNQDFVAQLSPTRERLYAELRAKQIPIEEWAELIAAHEREHAFEIAAESARYDAFRDATREARELAQSRFAVAVQASYIFTRALQNAVYCVILEASGKEHAGKFTSIDKAFKKRPGFASRLERAIPGYAEWFFDMRKIRNMMKDGVQPGWMMEGGIVGISVWEMRDSPPASHHFGDVTVRNVGSCLKQSARLLTFANAVEAGRGTTKNESAIEPCGPVCAREEN